MRNWGMTSRLPLGGNKPVAGSHYSATPTRAELNLFPPTDRIAMGFALSFFTGVILLVAFFVWFLVF